ncbi:MAG: D-sedoheptulose-7-phosphate isomerase [Christensenellales bacterium]|jgi:D-sedoheptulose 7-phosphate isomerase
MNGERILEEYARDCTERMMRTDFSALNQIIELFFQAKEKGNVIYTAGNGGSLATSSHICNDLLKGCSVDGKPGFHAECLGDSSAILTCLGNDFSYEDIFAFQLRTKIRPGDVLLVFSGSGNSMNVVKAVETANQMGAITVGFLGRDGGKLLPICHYSIIAPSDNMEQIEDIHMLYCHAMSYTIQKLFRSRSLVS